MLRILAALVAFALLGAAAHAIIVHTDGYGSPHGYITLALAAGVAVGALSIGAAWTQGRKLLALAICIALLCGEAFGLISTAERLVAQRDRIQAPIKAAIAARETARQHIADLEAAAAAQTQAAEQRIAELERRIAAAGTSDRLRAAEAAKLAADKAAIEKAAERGCARNCRALLEQQVSEAMRELTASRADIADRRAAAHAAVVAAKAEATARQNAAQAAIAAAQADFQAMRVPPSATPLADRLGLPGWLLDLTVAALGSIAANGLAAALLVFAGHGHARPHHAPATAAPRAVATEAETIDARELSEPIKLSVANVPEHAARFSVECLAPAPDRHAPLDAIKTTYFAWCAARGVAPLPDARIGRALADLFGAVGLKVGEIDGRLAVIGAEIKPQTALVKVG